MILRPVQRVNWSEFYPSRRAGEPRVVVDNVCQWDGVRRWDPDHLKTTVGDREVPIREIHGTPANIFQNMVSGGRILFCDYLDWVLDTADQLDPIARRFSDVSDIARAIDQTRLECSYYLDVKLGELSKLLLKEARVPGWYRTHPIDINFWCGVLGMSCGLHSDVTPNCNVQVIGRKHFILFPPSQSRVVYQVPGITHCRFDPNLPDFDRFPLARGAEGLQCTLQPRESLYIPVGWFHQVTVVSDWAVNVNFFWRRPFPQGLVVPGLWRFLLRRGWARVRAIWRTSGARSRMKGGTHVHRLRR